MTPAAGQAAGRPCATPAPGPHPAAPPPGSRYASAELAPDLSAAAKARRLIRDHLARWHMDDLADDAQAIASELAANASAPRGALSYPRYSRDELEGGSWV